MGAPGACSTTPRSPPPAFPHIPPPPTDCQKMTEKYPTCLKCPKFSKVQKCAKTKYSKHRHLYRTTGFTLSPRSLLPRYPSRTKGIQILIVLSLAKLSKLWSFHHRSIQVTHVSLWPLAKLCSSQMSNLSISFLISRLYLCKNGILEWSRIFTSRQDPSIIEFYILV